MVDVSCHGGTELKWSKNDGKVKLQISKEFKIVSAR